MIAITANYLFVHSSHIPLISGHNTLYRAGVYVVYILNNTDWERVKISHSNEITCFLKSKTKLKTIDKKGI